MEGRITKELLEEAFKTRIKSYKAGKPMEEYAGGPSDSFEVQLTTSGSDKRDLIIKLPKKVEPAPQEPPEKEKSEGNGFSAPPGAEEGMAKMFFKELDLYSIWFREVEKLTKEVKEDIMVGIPSLVAFKTGPDGFMAFEDFKLAGFKKCSDRLLDYHHCSLVMTEVAKMHATSWVIKGRIDADNLRSKYDFLHENFSSCSSGEMFEGMLVKTLSRFTKTVAKSEGEESPVYKAISGLTPSKLVEELNICVDQKDMPNKLQKMDNFLKRPTFQPEILSKTKPWALMCHSDLWAYNILYRYDEKSGKPDALKFIGFLVAHETCPMNELAYFFYLSTDHQTRKQIPDLLRIYQEKFLLICKAFGIPPPQDMDNFEHLCKRFRTARYFGFVNALLWYPLIFDKENPPEGKDKDKKQNEFAEFAEIWKEDGEAEGRLAEWLVELAKELHKDEII